MGTQGNTPQLASSLVRVLAALAIASALVIIALVVTLAAPAPGQGGLSGLAVMVGRGTDMATQILWQIRVPAMLTLLVAGSALGAAAGLLRAATRLPVADPGVLGLSALAALLMVLGGLVLPPVAASVLTAAMMLGVCAALAFVPWVTIRARAHRWVAVVALGLGVAGAANLLRWMILAGTGDDVGVLGTLDMVFSRSGAVGGAWLTGHGVVVALALLGVLVLTIVAPGPGRVADLLRFLLAAALLSAAVALIGAVAFLGLLAVWAARGLLGAGAVRWAPVVAAPLGATVLLLVHRLPVPGSELLLPAVAVPVIVWMISRDLRATDAAQRNTTSYAPPATPTPRSLYPPPR